MSFKELYGGCLHNPLKGVSVTEGFQWAALSRPDAVALTDAADGTVITYSQLQERVNRTALTLYNLVKEEPNLNPDGDCLVALFLKPSTDFIVIVLATMQVGCAYVALDVRFPLPRIEHILSDAKPLLFVSEKNTLAESSYSTKCVTIGDIKGMSEDVSLPLFLPSLSPMTSESLAVVLYTSGSTGTPKGVRIPHRALVNRLLWQWNTFPYTENEICCFKTASTFVDSLSEVFGPLLTGKSLIVVPKEMITRVDQFVNLLDHHKVRRLVLVPTLLRSILLHCSDLPVERRLPHLRLWICSGETLPASLLENFFEVFVNGQTICNFYGSTEVLGDVTYVEFKSKEDVERYVSDGNVPIGGVVANNWIYLDSPDTHSAEDSTDSPQIGEMCIYGENLTNGYVRIGNSDKFFSKTVGEEKVLVYRTGDYARLSDSLFYFEGRKDSQIKIRGHRVDCSEVQQAMLSLEGVEETIVLCYGLGTLQQKLVAFYSCVEGNDEPHDVSNHKFKSQLEDKLPTYMVPQLLRVTAMPLLVNGKVDRQRLLKMVDVSDEDIEIPESTLAGLTPSERSIAVALLGVVSKVIGVSPSKINIEDNYFYIGGNSLNVVMTITGLQDIDIQIGLPEFLECETLLDAVHTIIGKQNLNSVSSDSFETEERFSFHPITDEMKEEVILISAKSFTSKSSLEVACGVTESDYHVTLDRHWTDFVSHGLSFVACDKDGQIVGVSFNSDLHKEPELSLEGPIEYVFAAVEEVEAAVRSTLPTNPGEVVHSFLMATKETMTAKENMALVVAMERHNIKIATEGGYKAIFTSNSSDATRLVCCDIFNYKILSEKKMCLFTAEDGVQPFKSIPEEEVISAAVYYINK